MSTHPVPAARHDETPLPYAKIVAVGIATLAIFALAISWSTYMMNRTIRSTYPGGEVPVPQQVYQPEIGIVNQRMFELDQRATEKRQAQLDRLNSYGWVDQDNGIVHIPIQRAMELYLQEQQR